MVDHTVERRFKRRMLDLIEDYPDVVGRLFGDGGYLRACDKAKEIRDLRDMVKICADGAKEPNLPRGLRRMRRAAHRLAKKELESMEHETEGILEYLQGAFPHHREQARAEAHSDEDEAPSDEDEADELLLLGPPSAHGGSTNANSSDLICKRITRGCGF
jgi:hypothetical protein